MFDLSLITEQVPRNVWLFFWWLWHYLHVMFHLLLSRNIVTVKELVGDTLPIEPSRIICIFFRLSKYHLVVTFLSLAYGSYVLESTLRYNFSKMSKFSRYTTIDRNPGVLEYRVTMWAYFLAFSLSHLWCYDLKKILYFPFHIVERRNKQFYKSIWCNFLYSLVIFRKRKLSIRKIDLKI